MGVICLRAESAKNVWSETYVWTEVTNRRQGPLHAKKKEEKKKRDELKRKKSGCGRVF